MRAAVGGPFAFPGPMRPLDPALTIANHLLRVCLAPSCAGCDATLARPLDGPVCPACRDAIAGLIEPLCEVCGDQLEEWRPATPRCPRCRRADRGFQVARATGVYDGTLKALIHACKYGRHRGVGAVLSARLRQHGAAVLAGADAVVPVPLHPWRQLRRGFNQADDLAVGLGLPVWRILRRTRLGRAQASLPVSRRHANVRGAYAPAWRYRMRVGVPRVTGAVVVLVDDVMTTGATLSACARVLRRMGAREVRALTAARAVAGPRHPPPPPPHPSTVRRR